MALITSDSVRPQCPDAEAHRLQCSKSGRTLAGFDPHCPPRETLDGVLFCVQAGDGQLRSFLDAVAKQAAGSGGGGGGGQEAAVDTVANPLAGGGGGGEIGGGVGVGSRGSRAVHAGRAVGKAPSLRISSNLFSAAHFFLAPSLRISSPVALSKPHHRRLSAESPGCLQATAAVAAKLFTGGGATTAGGGGAGLPEGGGDMLRLSTVAGVVGDALRVLDGVADLQLREVREPHIMDYP